MNKFFIEHVQNYTATQKKEITIFLEYLEKISILAKKNSQTFLDVVKILNLMSFSKHQLNSWTHLNLQTNYPGISILNCCTNISAIYAVMSTLAKPNTI